MSNHLDFKNWNEVAPFRYQVLHPIPYKIGDDPEALKYNNLVLTFNYSDYVFNLKDDGLEWKPGWMFQIQDRIMGCIDAPKELPAPWSKLFIVMKDVFPLGKTIERKFGNHEWDIEVYTRNGNPGPDGIGAVKWLPLV